MHVCFMNHALSHKDGQIIEKKVCAHRSNTNDGNKKNTLIVVGEEIKHYVDDDWERGDQNAHIITSTYRLKIRPYT